MLHWAESPLWQESLSLGLMPAKYEQIQQLKQKIIERLYFSAVENQLSLKGKPLLSTWMSKDWRRNGISYKRIYSYNNLMWSACQKHTVVDTPLFKKGSTQDPGNYRPISILPVLSKLLEKHVAIHLLEFLNSHDLLHSQQSGFRAKHSCETALHYMLNDWLSSAHANELVGVMFIDFCKAFDLVDHKLLLEKLKLYKFSQSALHWFTCYLTERQQCVKVQLYIIRKTSMQKRRSTRLSSWPHSLFDLY